MPKKTFKGKTKFRTFALGSSEDAFDFQIKFDKFRGEPYAEIVPLSRRYAGKHIKSRAIRFHNKKAFDNFVKAVNELAEWIQDRTDNGGRSPWTDFKHDWYDYP